MRNKLHLLKSKLESPKFSPQPVGQQRVQREYGESVWMIESWIWHLRTRLALLEAHQAQV